MDSFLKDNIEKAIVVKPMDSFLKDKAIVVKPTYRFLKEVENLQMFSLSSDFDEQSLEDNTSSTTQVLQPSSRALSRYLRGLKQSLLSPRPSINELLRAPIVVHPRLFLDSSFPQYENIMWICFRSLPTISRFIYHELLLPESFDRLRLLSNSLGLTSNRNPLPSSILFPYSSSGTGFRGLINSPADPILFELMAFCNGMYGRYIVLVTLGVGCTVWYGFVPGIYTQAPIGGVFSPFETYAPFLDMTYSAPNFRRIGFVESLDVSATVESALRNEPTFAGITIPASGPVLTAVGLGLMVAILLAFGIVPDPTDVD